MKEYEKWFRKAENDLLTIRNNFNSSEIPFDTCCFHAQQAAEKYLKAYLIVRNIEFQKTHDLKKLIELCLTFNEKFNSIIDIATTLSEFGVTPRYPDGVDDITLEDKNKLTKMQSSLKNL